MRQFDVCRNVGRNRAAIPYVVILQSSRFATRRHRIVAPLLNDPGAPDADLGLRFDVAGQALRLDILQLAAVPIEALGPVVACLAAEADSGRIVAALDLLFSRAWD